MTPQRFRTLLAELVDENPFAIRAVLKILEVEFTERVPTMAVTREQRPRLLVNLTFVKEHCATDDHVKAVICHEFLHVLLCHTEDKRPLTPARHLAFDAVINAIIHRTFGPSFSSMMGKYYAKADDIRRILRPMNSEELRSTEKLRSKLPDWVLAWQSLYCGLLVADDIEQLAGTAATRRLAASRRRWPVRSSLRQAASIPSMDISATMTISAGPCRVNCRTPSNSPCGR